MPATSNLTNITLAEAADSANWDDIGGGPGSTQSDDLPIQGLEARGRRIDNTTRGFGFDNTTGIDISAANTHVGFWVNVLQPAQIGVTQGLEFSISDSGTNCQSGNWDGHQFTASDYPSTGGWQRVWIDPTRTRDAGSGTLSLTGVRNYGCEFEMGDVGGTSPNCNLDRIDYTATGITIDGGSGGTPAVWDDAISIDDTNAFGIINNDFLNGPLTIGGATATIFDDTNFAFKAGNQPLAAADWLTITADLTNASTIIDWGTWFLDGIGLVVTATSGTFDMGTGVMVNAPAITLNSQVTWAGKLALSDSLTAGGADLSNMVFEASTGTSALIWDTSDAPNTLTNDSTFISSGTGHGLELSTSSPLTITLTNVTFDNYAGSDGSTGNEAIWVRRTSGTVTINVSGGTTPSIRTDGATVNVVNSIDYQITGLDQNAVVTIVDITTPSTPTLLFEETAGVDNTITYSFDGALTNTSIDVLIRNTSIRNQEFSDTLPASSTSFPVSQVADTIYI